LQRRTGTCARKCSRGAFAKNLFYRLSSIQIRNSAAGGTAGGHSAAGAVFPEKIYGGLWKRHFGADAPGADGAAAASVAGERARAGKCDFQCVHYRDWGFHRSYGFAGNICSVGTQALRRGLIGNPFAGGAEQISHPARARYVQGNRLAGGADLGIGRTSLYRYLKT